MPKASQSGAVLACHVMAAVSLIALIAVCLAWETFLAPLRLGGSWLMLKTLPLLFPLFGILHGRRYTFQWASMLILPYFTEGAVRAWADHSPSSQLAIAEAVLSVAFFLSTIFYAKLTAPSATGSIKGASAPKAQIAP